MTFGSSNQVDSRVVELKFSNQQFENNAKKSLSTLERLKKALDFSKSRPVFTDISNGLKGLTVGPLISGLDQVQAKFSSLDVIAMSTLNRITNSAINMGEAFVKSVSTDQIEAGWNKYAEKTAAVQTIMAATAKEWGGDTAGQMEYVNGQLEKLNWFTDETSYSFLDMVSNIGKFTSNNVGLEQSVTAMEGISTWAAVSGANIGEAGRAMYNLSQAIAVGSVKLMDWKSIENANMATAEFKETAIQTAVELGQLTDAGGGLFKTLKGNEVSVSNFNQNLSDAWFTSDVLLKTLERYGGFTDELYKLMDSLGGEATTSKVLEFLDQYKEGSLNFEEASKAMGISAAEIRKKFDALSDDALNLGVKAFKAAQEAKTFTEAIDSVKDAVSTGWMNTFEALFGDYLKAKELWTGLANNLWDIFASGGERRNELLKEAFSEEGTINQSEWNKLTEAGLASPLFVSKLREAARAHSDYARWMIDDETWLKTALEKNLITVSDFKNAWNTVFGGPSFDSDLMESIDKLSKVDEEVQHIMSTFDKWSGEDVDSIIWGNHKYDNDTRELEQGIDTILEKLGLEQDAAKGVVEVFKSMGYFGGEAVENWDGLSKEELRAKGLTDELIAAYDDAVHKGKTAEEVKNAILMASLSPKEMWFTSLHDGMKALVALFGVAKEAWEEVFPPATVDTIRSIVQDVYDAVQRFKDWVDTSDALRVGLRAIFSVVDIIWTVVRSLATGAVDVVRSFFSGLGLDVGGLVVKFGNLIIKAREWIKTSDIVGKAMKLISTISGLAGKQIRKWFDAFKSMPTVSKTLSNFKEGFKSALSQLPTFVEGLTERFSEFGSRVGKLDGLKLNNIGDVFQAFKETVLDYFVNFPGFQGIRDAFAQLKEDVKGKLESMGVDVDGIKQKFEGAKTFALTALGSLGQGALQALGWVTSLFNKIGQSQFVQTNMARFKNAFAGFRDNIGPWIEGAKWRFSEFMEKVRNIGGFKLDNLSSIFSAFKETVIDNFDSSIFDPLVEAFEGVKNDVKAKLLEMGIDVDGIKEKISGAIDSIKETLSNFSLPDVFSNILSIFKKDSTDTEEAGFTLSGAIGTVVEAAETAESKASGFPQWLSDLARGILALVIAIAALKAIGTIKNIVNSMAELNKAQAKKINRQSLLLLAISIGILAASVYALAQVPLGSLIQGVAAVAALAAVLLGLSALTAKFTAGSDLAKIGGGLLMISGAILVMALSMKVLESLKIEELPKVIALLGGIMLSLVVLAGAMAKIGGTFQGGLGILAIAASLYLIIGVIEILDDLEVEHPKKVILGLLGLIAVVALMFLTTKLAGADANSSALAIVAIGAALILMAGALLLISAVPEGKLGGALGALAVMTLCVAALTAAARGIKVGTAAPILMLGVVLLAIAASIIALSFIEKNKLKAAAIALGAILVVLTIFTGVTQYLSKGQSFKSVLGSIVTIAAVVAALIVLMYGVSKLAEIDPDHLNAATIALGVLGAVLAGLMIVSNFCSGGSILKLFGVVAAVGVLALILGLLSNLTEPTSLLTTAASLSMLSVAIGVLLGILALVGLAGPAVWNGLAALGVLVGAFLILGVIFGAIEKLTGGGFSDFVGKGMDVLVKVAEGIGRFFGAIIAGISIESVKALPEIADALVSFMTKLQGLDNVGHINWGAFLEALGAVTGVSFTELLTAIPNIVTEFATGKPAMAQFSEDLGYLSTALVDWQDKMSSVGKIVIDNKGISSLCHAIAEIALLGIGDAISSFITSFAFGEGVTPVKQFSNDLGVLSTALSDWQEKMSGIGTLIVDSKGISDLVKAIGDIAFLEIGDAISSLITSFAFGEGVSAVEQFSNNLGVLSTGLSDWQEKMNTIGTIKIPSDKIDELSENIKKIEWDSFKGALADGITKMLTGEDTLHRFKTKTNTLARALSDWQTKMEEIGAISVPSAEITSLAEAIEKIPDTGIFGAIASFLGFQSDVESFASEIGALGTGLKEFSDNIGPNYNGESLITAIDTLTAIATNATDIASFSEWMNSNLGLFGGQLGKLAQDINEFVNKVAEDEENYDKVGGLVAKILNSLGLIAIATISDETGSLSDTTAVDTLIQNITNLVDLIGEKLGGFDGSGVEAFTSAVKSLSEADISGAVDKMYASNGGKESKAMSESGSAMGASLATSMGEQTGAMKDAMGSLTGAATEALSGASDAFGTKGTELIGAMAAAVAEATSFSDALVAMVREAANGLDTNALYNSGVYFVKGFAQGIIDTTSEATGRAAAMARAAMLAVQSTIKQGSPSREMMKSGMWFALGFSQGIGNYAYTAFDAAAEMGAGTMDSMRKAVGSVKDILTADLSGDPVIRPVLDLSEIESGASTIGGLFGNMQPISLMSDLDIIQTNSQAMKRRASTDDLLTALGSLAVTGDTYNYNVGGVSYDDGTNIAAAVRTLAHAVRAGGRA